VKGPALAKARTWLIGHMERLSKDPNLGAERQQQTADGALQLAAGADEVQIGVKTYGIICRPRVREFGPQRLDVVHDARPVAPLVGSGHDRRDLVGVQAVVSDYAFSHRAPLALPSACRTSAR